MRIICTFVVLAVSACMQGCGPSAADAESTHADVQVVESPEQVVASMLALARAGDWTTYIDRHYGEQHKFRGPEDREQLADMLASRADEVMRGLEQVEGLTPEISSDGATATFALPDGGAFMLYRESGGWKFHL